MNLIYMANLKRTLFAVALLFTAFGAKAQSNAIPTSATAAKQANASSPGKSIDKVIAKVDNYIILKSELEMSYFQALSNGEKDDGDLRCEILENLVVNKMMLAKADIDSIVVDNKMVEEQLDRRMQYFVQQVGSREKLEEYYKKSIDQLKGDLRKQVKEQMVVEKVQRNITEGVKITPSEVKKFFNKIPKDSLPYFSTEVEVAQIVRFPQVSRAQKQAAREKLNELRARIVKGEDFARLAEIHSEDPGSARMGGELGWWGRGAMVPEYEAAALALKPGEMSAPVESAFGFHLIQLIEKKGNEYNSRHILIKPESSDADIKESFAYLDSLRSKIVRDSITFEKAAREYSEDQLTKSTGGFFTDPNTNSNRISVEVIDPVVFFVIDTMNLGQISQPIPYRTEDGKEGLRIIYYKNKIAPHQANLKDDYQKIYTYALTDKKNRIISEWFEKTKNEVYINIDPAYKECDVLEQTNL
jgi:peptidyl-prolyl cis-trans isomerase SurA